jgi:hypothetical protein
MLAHWKPLALVAIGIVAILWFGPHNDSGEASAISELNAPTARGCVVKQPARCTIDIRYAYPAAELFVLPEDVYF